MRFPSQRSSRAGRALVLVVGLACAGAFPVVAQEAVPTVSFSELQRGQKGYGLTVFAGQEPERFEVEVIGVQQSNDVAGLDYLITRLSGHGLEKSGVAAGMSGSPVYFDGRLAGAVAFTFHFASEPIAGITPIAAMRAIPGGERQIAAAAPPAGGGGLPETAPVPAATLGLPRVALQDLLAERSNRAAFDQVLELLAPGSTGPGASGGRSTLSFTASGFGGAARRLLEGRLGPLQPLAGLAGGRATGAASAARPVGAGDSVALVMVRGDLGIAAVGTLTDRVGEQVVAFGHRIFGGSGGIGPLRFPMAEADVVTVMPGLQESFKIANVGPLIGSFLEDRGAGSRGVVGPIWPMTPLAVKIYPAAGGPPRDYHLEVASDPLFRGFLMTLSLVGAISSAGRDQGAQNIDLDVTYHLKGQAPVRGRHSYAGGQAAYDAAFKVMEYATYFAFNDFAPVDIDRVEVELRMYEEERRSKVLAAWPDRRTVAPGETLGLTVELEDYRGTRWRQRTDFAIPANVSGRFYILIGDGRTTDTAYAQVEKVEPKTLAQGLELLRRARSSRELHLFGLEQGAGITFGGRALPDLPASQRALLGGAAEAPLAFRIAGEKIVPLERPATGMVRIDLEVERRRAP